MPMRGELASPALRSRRRRGSNETGWRGVCDAFNSLDLGVVIFSASGLLVTLVLATLDPSIAAAIGHAC
jgi:hypothetical protein